MRARPAARCATAGRQCPLPELLRPAGPYLLLLRGQRPSPRDHCGRRRLPDLLPAAGESLWSLRTSAPHRPAGRERNARPLRRLPPAGARRVLKLRPDAAVPTDLLRPAGLQDMPTATAATVRGLLSFPSGPGRMAHRSGLPVLLRADTPQAQRVRKLSAQPSPDRQEQ